VDYNNSMDLARKHCEPCEGGVKPFGKKEIKKYLKFLNTHWKVNNDKEIEKEFKFKDFKEAIRFVNKTAEIAEAEGHHPDITINYNKVKINLSTHAIKGLSVNDFILARKIESLYQKDLK